jgi:hypothetical protein
MSEIANMAVVQNFEIKSNINLLHATEHYESLSVVLPLDSFPTIYRTGKFNTPFIIALQLSLS